MWILCAMAGGARYRHIVPLTNPFRQCGEAFLRYVGEHAPYSARRHACATLDKHGSYWFAPVKHPSQPETNGSGPNRFAPEVPRVHPTLPMKNASEAAASPAVT